MEEEITNKKIYFFKKLLKDPDVFSSLKNSPSITLIQDSFEFLLYNKNGCLEQLAKKVRDKEITLKEAYFLLTN